MRAVVQKPSEDSQRESWLPAAERLQATTTERWPLGIPGT